MPETKVVGADLLGEVQEKVEESSREDFVNVLSIAVRDIEKRESHVGDRMDVLAKKKTRLENLKTMDIPGFKKYIKARRKKGWSY